MQARETFKEKKKTLLIKLIFIPNLSRQAYYILHKFIYHRTLHYTYFFVFNTYIICQQKIIIYNDI